MSTFDEVKETLTNKLDELKSELKDDSTEQRNETVSEERNNSNEIRDPDNADGHTQEVGNEYLESSIVEEEPEERLDTDYDLAPAADGSLNEEESYDSGLDDSQEDSVNHEIVNDDNGNLFVEKEVDREETFVTDLDNGFVTEDDSVEEVVVTDDGYREPFDSDNTSSINNGTLNENGVSSTLDNDDSTDLDSDNASDRFGYDSGGKQKVDELYTNPESSETI